MDKFGRKGRYNTFRVLHKGINIGSQFSEPVEPAADFKAGMVGHKDPTTGRVSVCTTADLGASLGILGDQKTTTPALLAIKERVVVVATGAVKMKHPLIYDFGTPAAGSGLAFAYNVTTSTAVPQAELDLVAADGDTDFAHGLVAFADDVVGFTPVAGNVLEVTYYYKPVKDDFFPTGINETRGSGAVTIWTSKGFYATNQIELLDNAGASGLPAINDPLYCSPAGKLSADVSTVVGGPVAIAICRSDPYYENDGLPWINFELI